MNIARQLEVVGRQIRRATMERHGFLRIMTLAYGIFRSQHCLEKAAALTYSTLLALVPLLAIMFALLKGLGVHNSMEPLLLKYLSSGSDEVVSRVIGYINNTNVGSLGAVGVITLVLTVLFLLSNIEKSFNSLWQVQESRSWFRRFADYFSVVTFGPLFLLAAISMSSSLHSQALVQWIVAQPYLGEAVIQALEIIPFLVIWAAFIFLYLFMPNTRVTFSAAALGGVSAGTLWLVSQWAYVTFQIGVGKYNAIYGTMAALPVFMVWMYIGWIITLAGVALSRAWQGRHSISVVRSATQTCWHPLQVLAVLVLLYRRFNHGVEPWYETEFLNEVGIDPDVCMSILNYLEREKVLVRIEHHGREAQLLPGCSPTAINLQQLLMPDINLTQPDDVIQVMVQHWNEIQGRYLQCHDLRSILAQEASTSENEGSGLAPETTKTP